MQAAQDQDIWKIYLRFMFSCGREMVDDNDDYLATHSYLCSKLTSLNNKDLERSYIFVNGYSRKNS